MKLMKKIFNRRALKKHLDSLYLMAIIKNQNAKNLIEEKDNIRMKKVIYNKIKILH